jgi:S1-C subfamily serine protease
MVLDYRNRELALSRGQFEPPGPRIVLESFFKNLTGERPAEVIRPPALWGLVVAKRAIDPRPGVTLTRVLPGGAASEAGLKVGDRVLTIDGRWTDTVLDCHRAAARIPPGRPAEVSIWRDGRPLTVKVTPRRGL